LHFVFDDAKVRISERKTKEKMHFLLFFRAKVRSTKSKIISFF